MQLNEIVTHLLQSDALLPGWQPHYPVAIVHDLSRVKEKEIAQKLKEEGFAQDVGLVVERWQTPYGFDDDELERFENIAPGYLKRADILIHKDDFNDTHFYFKQRRNHDQYKRIVDKYNTFFGIVKRAEFEDCNICRIEKCIRDDIRFYKEIPSLRDKPFFYKATLKQPCDLNALLAHYFQGGILCNENTYVAWTPSLECIDMRRFYSELNAMDGVYRSSL